MKLAHWPLMRAATFGTARRGLGWACSLPRPVLAVPNVIAHPSTVSVPITVLLYNSLMCPLKG